MTCEGSEFEILKSMDSTHWAQIERIVVEYHDYGDDRKHGELVEIIRNNGFDVEVVQSMLGYLFGFSFRSRLGMIWAKKRISA